MENNFSRGIFFDSLEKIDRYELQSKLYLAIYMLKKGDVNELKTLINSVNISIYLENLNKIKKSDLIALNIDVNDIKERITDHDLDKLVSVIGTHGNEFVKKIKELLEYK